MGVAAEHAVGLPETGVQNRPGRNFVREAKPACVQAVSQSRDILTFEIQFLKIQMQQRAHAAEHQIPGNEPVELMAVNRQVPFAGEIPCVLLIDPYADQMRHDGTKPAIVIAFDPNHLDISFGI
jgi:hypothetical protein